MYPATVSECHEYIRDLELLAGIGVNIDKKIAAKQKRSFLRAHLDKYRIKHPTPVASTLIIMMQRQGLITYDQFSNIALSFGFARSFNPKTAQVYALYTRVAFEKMNIETPLINIVGEGYILTNAGRQFMEQFT